MYSHSGLDPYQDDPNRRRVTFNENSGKFDIYPRSHSPGVHHGIGPFVVDSGPSYGHNTIIPTPYVINRPIPEVPKTDKVIVKDPYLKNPVEEKQKQIEKLKKKKKDLQKKIQDMQKQRLRDKENERPRHVPERQAPAPAPIAAPRKREQPQGPSEKQRQLGDQVRKLEAEKDKLKKDIDKIKDENDDEKGQLKEKAIKGNMLKDDYQKKLKDLDDAQYELGQKEKALDNDKKNRQADLENQYKKRAELEGQIAGLKSSLKDKENQAQKAEEKADQAQQDADKHMDEIAKLNKKIAQLESDLGDLRKDRDRLADDLQKRTDAANKKYSDLYDQFLQQQSDQNEKQAKLDDLDAQLQKKKRQAAARKMENKALKEQLDDMDRLQNKIKQKEQKIYQLEADLEQAKRDQQIEYVERIIQKPIVVEQPVIIEQPVVMKEESNNDIDLHRLREQVMAANRGYHEQCSEAEYWRRRCIETEDQCRNQLDNRKNSNQTEKQIFQDKLNEQRAIISDQQGKINSLLGEIQELANINFKKNQEISDMHRMYLDRN